MAVSDPLRIIASYVGTVPNDDQAFRRLGEFVHKYDVRLIVVGMPYTLKGEKGEKAREVEAFIEKLKQSVKVDVVTVDERFTSAVAQQTMRTMGSTKSQRRDKGRIDQMASALILQSYLDRGK